MHELSIAKALMQLAERFRPAGSHVRGLHVQAGPLQAIEPAAMQWAWQAATVDTEYADSKLLLKQLPWRLRCPECGLHWQAPRLDSACRCGSRGGVPAGGDELMLVSLDVDGTNAPAARATA